MCGVWCDTMRKLLGITISGLTSGRSSSCQFHSRAIQSPAPKVCINSYDAFIQLVSPRLSNKVTYRNAFIIHNSTAKPTDSGVLVDWKDQVPQESLTTQHLKTVRFIGKSRRYVNA